MRTPASRRDNGGRPLQDGERQKKNGLYEYRYYDANGIRKSIYSWRLSHSDPVPKGKRYCEALRDMEREIQQDLNDGITPLHSQKATLNERFDLHIKGKLNLSDSTRTGYIYNYNKYVRKGFGKRQIGNINYSDMKRFYNELITKHGLKPNSMEVVHTILNPVFEKAVFDNLIRKNPCIPAMKEIRQMKEWQPKKVTTKYAFTVEQQMAFVDFMRSNSDYSRWKNILTVLLGTGMRIGECTGLVWKNCDFKNDCIYITHTLIYRQWEDGTCGYRVHPAPKTKAGIRTIPMMKEVREALLAEKAYQEQHGTANTVIDGYSDWVFTNRYGTVLSLSSVNDGIARIIRDYNEKEKENAELESRDAVLIPHMTTHQLRHSFCTRLMEESINNDNMIPLAVIQSLMGHKDVKTTIEIYTDVSEELKRKALEKVKNNIYLGQVNP